MNYVFASLKEWFKAKRLTLSFDKTDVMKFYTTIRTYINLNIGYVNRTTEEVEITKFLDPQSDSNLNWKKHIEYIIPKLGLSCFAMRTVTLLMKIEL
jgi:hypothetical protein